MARIWVEGFESGNLSNFHSGKGGECVSPPAGMTGNYCLQLSYVWGNWQKYQFRQDYPAFYMMFRYRYGSWSGEASERILYFMDHNGTVIAVLNHFNELRVLKLYRGNCATELATGVTPILPYNTYRIEIYYKPHNTNGVYQIRVDGRPVEAEYIGDTTDGLEHIRSVQFYQNSYDAVWFDDVIVDDTDWVGNSRVKVIVPDGPGGKQFWSSSMGEFDIFTKSLLHLDGNLIDSSLSVTNFNNSNAITFVDSSPLDLPLQLFGNVSLSAVTSKVGICSAYFDGNGDYLKTTTYVFGTSSFTMAAWVYLLAMPTSDAWPTSWGSHMIVMGNGTPGSSTGCDLLIGQTTLKFHSNDTVIVSGTHGMTAGVWYHLAVVRDGNTFYLFVDGVQIATATSSATMGTGNGFYIGSEAGEGAWFNGYMDELILSSQALWTSNFTPPIEEYTPDANTKLLCHFDYPEWCPVLSSDFYKFGTHSVYFSGAVGYLYAPAGANFAIGTNKFAIDCWVRPTFIEDALRVIYDIRAANSDTAAGFMFGVKNKKLVFYSNGLDRIIGDVELTENTWHHVALTGNKTHIEMYLNGVRDGGSYEITYNYTQNTPTIGANNNRNDYFWAGYIDEFRLSIGTFRWYKDFVPKTEAYTNHNEDNNWEAVNEVPANDSDYIFTGVIGNTDTYKMTELEKIDLKIKSVRIDARCKQLGEPDATTFQFVCRGGDIDYLSATQYPPDSFGVTASYIWDNCPVTTEKWTKESFEACEFGVKATE